MVETHGVARRRPRSVPIACVHAGAEHDIGLFRIRDQFLLNMGFLAFDPDSARLLRPGEQQAELIETTTNTFAHSGALNWLLEARPARAPVDLPMLRSLPGNIFYLDGETYRTALSLRGGLTRRLQVGVTAQLLGIEEGHLDRPIEAFHEIFDRDQHGRRGVPRNSYLVYIRSNGTEFYQDEAPGFRFGDVVLQAKVGLIDGDARALSLRRRSSSLTASRAYSAPVPRTMARNCWPVRAWAEAGGMRPSACCAWAPIRRWVHRIRRSCPACWPTNDPSSRLCRASCS